MPAADANAAPEALLGFWFGVDLDDAQAVAARSRLWFTSSAAFDQELARHFGALPERGLAGELRTWEAQPRSALALVLALDQLPRNLFRGSPRAFAFDAAARDVALGCIERGFDARLPVLEAAFLYLPLEHAESLELQQRSVELFGALRERGTPKLEGQLAQYTAYAERHRAVIERFGRFPHRNATLGRVSTREETMYLAADADAFGG